MRHLISYHFPESFSLESILAEQRMFHQEGPWVRMIGQDFPGGPVVKNPPANAGDKGSNLGLGRFHMPRVN